MNQQGQLDSRITPLSQSGKFEIARASIHGMVGGFRREFIFDRLVASLIRGLIMHHELGSLLTLQKPLKLQPR